MAWDDARKQQAIDAYTNGNPTPENSMELVKDIAEEMGETPNGVRMILTKAGVYIKKDGAPSASSSASSGAKSSSKASGSPRVSKEDSQAALIAAITAAGHTADTDIISKLTGKAAVYFTSLFTK